MQPGEVIGELSLLDGSPRVSREKVTQIEAEVSGLSSGLTGLLESEGGQREPWSSCSSNCRH